MKYSELVAELNKKYETDVFYKFYEGFDAEIEDYTTQTTVHFKSQIGEEFTVDIDLKTLEIKSIYTYKSIDIKTIEAIAKGSQTDKVKKLEKKVNELEVSAGLQAQTIKSQRAALNYAQETILRAIRGE